MLSKLHPSAGFGGESAAAPRGVWILSITHLRATTLAVGLMTMLIPAPADAKADIKMFRACQDGKTEVLLKRLARGTEVNLAATNGATCLIVALQGGHLETARVALEQVPTPMSKYVSAAGLLKRL